MLILADMEETMTDGWKKFLWGVAAGAVAAAFVQTDTFKKGAAKALACGAQLKEDAKEYFETLKEDVEDLKAESSVKA